MHDGGKKAIIAAFLANLGIAISKMFAFAMTGAASMFAESIHSLADTANQALLLFGSRRSKKAPTSDHPFGYGPERYFWSFIVALVLFSLGGLFALFEGIEKLIDPHELESYTWAFAVLIVALVLEGFSMRTAIRESKTPRGKMSYRTFIRKSKHPELPVVLLEDAGALLGLLFALTGLTLARITGNSRFDAMGSIAVGALLVIIAIVLATEMKSLLIGESVSEEMSVAIRNAILDGDEILSIIHLRTMHLGPDDILLGVKVECAAETKHDIANSIDAVEKRVRDAVPTVRTIYIEPDVRRDN